MSLQSLYITLITLLLNFLLTVVFCLLGQIPSLPQLLRLQIYHSIGTKYKIFGIFLLNDKAGSYIDAIEDEHYGNIEFIVMKILQVWLMGCGRAVKWHILVETLRECELHCLANKIEYKIKGMYHQIHIYIILYWCRTRSRHKRQ